MMSSLLAALLIFSSPSIRAEADIASPEIVRLEAKLKQELSGKSDGSISPQDYEVFVAEYRPELAQTVKTLPASPANIEVHARILILLGDAELSTKQLQEALSAAPKNDELTLALGRNYLGKADYSSALSAAEAVLERDPKNEAALFLKYSSLDRVTRTGDPAATLPRGAVEQPRSERTAVAAMTRSRRVSEIDVPLNTEEDDAGSDKNPRPLWPLAVPIGVGLIGYGVSRKNSTWISKDGLDPAPHVPDDNAARNWRRSAAVAGAAFIGLAAWEFGPAAWSAAEGFIASGSASATLTPAIAGGAGTGGATAITPAMVAAQANVAGVAIVAVGALKAAEANYSYSKSDTPNEPSTSRNKQVELGRHKSAKKWRAQMEKRGWTEQQIEEAIVQGERHRAENLVHPENGATRYVHARTGRSVVVDDVTREVLQVAGDGFKF